MAAIESPTGLFEAEMLVYDCPIETGRGEDVYPKAAWRVKRLRASSGLSGWSVNCDSLRPPATAYWSSDSSRFYFDPEEHGCLNSIRRIVIRDSDFLNSGLVGETFTGGPNFAGLPFRTASWQANYTRWEDGAIAFMIPDAHNDWTFIPPSVPDGAHGPISWAPDGLAFAYIQTTHECNPYGISYVAVIVLEQLDSTILLQSAHPIFIDLDWWTQSS
jgi:hypothetical protein